MSKQTPIYEFAEINSVEDLLWLPLKIETGKSIAEILEQRMNHFVDDLAIPYLKEECQESIPVKNLMALQKGIVEVLHAKNDEGRYEALKHTLDKIDFCNMVYKKELTSDMNLYRARTGNIKLERKEFYHPPFKKEHKNGTSGRFNSADEINWYLGESAEVCRAETKVCPMVVKLSMKKKYDRTLRVVDLTAEALTLSKDDKGNVKGNIEGEIILFPLILACYCYSEEDGREEEIYRIPQLVARYIHENASSMGIKGIQYFTVRNEELNPLESTYKNICLFPEKSSPNKKYDLELMHKFKFEYLVANE